MLVCTSPEVFCFNALDRAYSCSSLNVGTKDLAMTLILGIDPGSRITGYGVIRDNGRMCEYVASGCIRTGTGELAERLNAVFAGVSQIIQTYQPDTMGIEQVFMARNADSA